MRSSTLLNWIDLQHPSQIELLKQWSAINSYSENMIGLQKMLEAIIKRFSALGGEVQTLDLPPRLVINDQGQMLPLPHGKAFHMVKRPQAPFRVFLGGHMDTVYAEKHPFQKTEMISPNIMRGPGVTDMKGGLIVMLTALEAFEKDPNSHHIGWEVVINPDEEIGSLGSQELLKECAQRNHLGLIFEPSFEDGALVSSRKGTANITVIAHGKAAHAGRDFSKGRNAIAALAEFAIQAHALNDQEKGISVNLGHITGGGPVNVVPDLAICRLNVRAVNVQDFENIQKDIQNLVENTVKEGIKLSYYLQNARKPKPLDSNTEQLFNDFNECAQKEGFKLSHRMSGGVCDGNLLAEEGLTVLDSLGVIGGEIHTVNEFIILDSLLSRTRLVARFLSSLAARESSHYYNQKDLA